LIARSLFLLRHAGWIVALLPIALGHAATDDATPDTRHIANIERGLLPTRNLAAPASGIATLADEMRRLHVPGVSVAVIHDGRIAWAKGYGVTRAGGKTPVTPATLFQAASISKSVTAVAAMRMVQDGVLELDRPANDYLVSWKLPATPDSGLVTVRQLLSHTAGVTVGGFPGYAAGSPVPTLIQVLDGVPPAVTEPVRVTGTPGTGWRYSGGGYTVIQQLMMDVDKKSFATLMDERVLQPMQMRDSGFSQPASAAMLDHAAMPHDASGIAYAGGPRTYPELSAAGLWSTPTDLAKLLIGLQGAAAGKAAPFLSAATAKTMFTVVRNGYALGFKMEAARSLISFGHGGHNHGYQSSMLAYLDSGEGVIVMTNGDGGDELAEALIRAVAAEYGWPPYRP
jgi:CubicO group peptidase (beta-lactamase class C family)